MKNYIIALDQGTTSSRAILFNQKGQIVSTAQQEFTQHFPKPGWVEHDPEEIWSSQLAVVKEIMSKTQANEIAAIGITNQRETTIVWDAITGKPIGNAIVWQDRRTAAYCDSIKTPKTMATIQQKTGLLIDAYFSATKIRWMLDHVPGAREKAEQGILRFGTVDSWLVWKLTKGKRHVTDVTNASRTMLFNIHAQQWDDDLLKFFDIPETMLPTVCSSSEIYGMAQIDGIDAEIPIAGMAGDQQSALFGQLCLTPGSVKNTYGTGCFMLMNTGEQPVVSKNNLLTTIAWKINGKVTYAIEGSVFVAGSVIQWLRDGMHLFKTSSETEQIAQSVPDNAGVYFVPALTGLGAPHWDPFATGSIYGITRGTQLAHIVRAALEGIAFQTMDILKAMERDANVQLNELRVDGGAANNNFLMQFQADVLRTTVIRPQCTETTARGACFLAGLAVGFWHNMQELKEQLTNTTTFSPAMCQDKQQQLVAGWEKAISRTLTKKQ